MQLKELLLLLILQELPKWVPDVKDDGTTKWYDMYWMGTFKSEEELAEFIKEYN